MKPRTCPALFVSAPASNQGKTTVTAALARHHARQGRHVRVFKTGPDFLDPMILERASGRPVYQLDLWMGGEDHCRELIYDAAAEADLILIEGVMGLFDGTPSSGDLAQLFGVPVLAVIDAESMAQTFSAIAHGLASYRKSLPFYGVLANRVAGARHAEMTQQGMPPGLAYLGAITRDGGFELPDRHLGLVQAEEVGDLDQRLDALAAVLQGTRLTELPPAVEFSAPGASALVRGAGRRSSAMEFGSPREPNSAAETFGASRGPDAAVAEFGASREPDAAVAECGASRGPDAVVAECGASREPDAAARGTIRPQAIAPLLRGVRIGVARDRAFSFLYHANLDLLRAMGAQLVFFSPLADAELPAVDSVYLPGGYPELHLQQLGANRALAKALRNHVDAGKPLYAECGGMLYLLETLTDVDGQHAEMVGLLPGRAAMQPRLRGLGYQSAPLPGGVLRGHTFHHSTMETSLTPWAHGERLYSTSPGEAIYRQNRLVASYLHNYFPSNPEAAAGLFRRAEP
jgi:cobyrinic acid a,c-diamide synthase